MTEHHGPGGVSKRGVRVTRATDYTARLRAGAEGHSGARERAAAALRAALPREVPLRSAFGALAILLASLLVAPAWAQTPAKPGTAPPKPAAAPPKTTSGATKPAAKPATARPAAPKGDGEGTRLDGIAAVVNEDVVLQSDVEDQLYQFVQQSHAQPDPAQLDTLRHQILDQLINEKLIVAEAKRQGISATEVEINQQVDDALRQQKEALGGEQGFQNQLKAENTTEAQVRARYHDQAGRDIVTQRMIRKALPPKPATATEAETYFKAHPDKFPKRPADVRLQVIQIPATADSATDAAGRAAAVAARQRILAGEKFAKVAGELSQDPGSSKSGGDLGYFTRGSMEPAFEQIAFSLKPGELSPPVRTPFGWHILEVIDRDTVKTRAGRDSTDDKGAPVLEAHVRHILIRVPVSDADGERARALAERVRNEAVKGTDFGTLAHRYSKYSGPQDDKGDIGFISIGTLQPQIRAGLDTLEIGQVSPILQNAVGFNIFKLVDRRPERAYTLEEIKDELPQAVTEIKFRERYDEWVKGLRAKAHVEVHGT
jgi:peptidyl-prolyl cis-trans isomerase SurA